LASIPYKVLTYRDIDLRKAVALKMANAATEEEAVKDPEKARKYYYYMDTVKVKMAGYHEKSGKYVKGIEDYLPRRTV